MIGFRLIEVKGKTGGTESCNFKVPFLKEKALQSLNIDADTI